MPAPQAPAPPRAQLRLRSLGWAVQAAVVAGGVAVAAPLLAAAALGTPVALSTVTAGLEAALRAGGCGFFYGLLAFHLQRVDPDDGHLQAGLVGAICAIRSLASPLLLQGGLPTVMMEALRTWPPLWLPVIAAALWLQGAQRWLPPLRP